MKRVVFLTVAALMAASMVFAQAGSIGIFADPMGTNCNLPDVSGLGLYYVVQVNSPGATACAFWAPKPACFTGTYLSDGSVFPVTIGNSQTGGVSIGYGSCRPSPLHVLTLQFFTSGTSAPCCYYPVQGMPLSGQVEVVDCANNLVYGTGGKGIIKANPACQCNVPTEETTWGQVKSLYGE